MVFYTWERDGGCDPLSPELASLFVGVKFHGEDGQHDKHLTLQCRRSYQQSRQDDKSNPPEYDFNSVHKPRCHNQVENAHSKIEVMISCYYIVQIKDLQEKIKEFAKEDI